MHLDGLKILLRICRPLNLDRNESIEVLSRICRRQNSPRWIENLSKSYQADRMLRNLARWIEEAVENLSRRNPQISMDRESIEVLSRLKKESSIEMNLSGIYREAVELEKKEFFKGGKTHRYECNK